MYFVNNLGQFTKVESSVQTFTVGEKIILIYKADNKLIYREKIYDKSSKKCMVGDVITFFIMDLINFNNNSKQSNFSEFSEFTLASLSINVKGCIWGVDELGNVLMRNSVNSLNKIGKQWQIIRNINYSLGFKDLSLNERDLWLISLDGDPFIISNVCY